jgi:flagellar protein FliS
MDAAAAYKRRALESASPIGLIVLLYQAACQNLRRAIAAVEAGDIETRTAALNQVLAIIAELNAALDFERGVEVARQFARFYHVAQRTVLDASFRQAAAPLRELLDSFTQVQAAWQRADALPPGASSVEHAGALAASSQQERVAWQA